jgi:hypothetical protein
MERNSNGLEQTTTAFRLSHVTLQPVSVTCATLVISVSPLLRLPHRARPVFPGCVAALAEPEYSAVDVELLSHGSRL